MNESPLPTRPEKDTLLFHVRFDDFFAGSERRRRGGLPKRYAVLRGGRRPVLVGASDGVARRFAEARRHLPPEALEAAGLPVIAVDEDAAREDNERIRRAFHALSPRVASPDLGVYELDMSGTSSLMGPPLDAAKPALELARTLGHVARIGVSPRRLGATLAAHWARPGAAVHTPASCVNALLALTPVAALGVYLDGGLRHELAFTYRVGTAGAALALGEAAWTAWFGDAGRRAFRRLQADGGATGALVVNETQAESAKERLCFDSNDAARARSRLKIALYRMMARLRGRGKGATRLALTAHYADGLRETRRTSFEEAAAGAHSMEGEALRLLALLMERRLAVRELLIEIGGLTDGGAQLRFGDEERGLRLEQAAERLQARFGERALAVAAVG